MCGKSTWRWRNKCVFFVFFSVERNARHLCRPYMSDILLVVAYFSSLPACWLTKTTLGTCQSDGPSLHVGFLSPSLKFIVNDWTFSCVSIKQYRQFQNDFRKTNLKLCHLVCKYKHVSWMPERIQNKLKYLLFMCSFQRLKANQFLVDNYEFWFSVW